MTNIISISIQNDDLAYCKEMKISPSELMRLAVAWHQQRTIITYRELESTIKLREDTIMRLNAKIQEIYSTNKD